MRKLLLAFLMFTLCSLPIEAKVMKAKAVNQISTKTPAETISVKLVRGFDFENGLKLEKGTILTGTMTDIKKPENWHHNATFTFTPYSYTEKNGTTHNIQHRIPGTYRQKMKPDFKHSDIGGDGIFFSPSYFDNTKRMLHGETKQVFEEYKNRKTPWGMGEEITIKPKETLYFNFLTDSK